MKREMARFVEPFESRPANMDLSVEQVIWLDRCTIGHWRFNHWTGEVDVVGSFDCSDERLSDFKGVRFGKVDGSFSCSNNNLTSLEGAPEEVVTDFSCNNNLLTSLEGAPRKVGEGFYCEHNPVSGKTITSIFTHMRWYGDTYLKAVESIWSEIPLDDQLLLYRPEFGWIGSEDARKLEALMTYERIKNML